MNIYSTVIISLSNCKSRNSKTGKYPFDVVWAGSQAQFCRCNGLISIGKDKTLRSQALPLSICKLFNTNKLYYYLVKKTYVLENIEVDEISRFLGDCLATPRKGGASSRSLIINNEKSPLKNRFRKDLSIPALQIILKISFLNILSDF